MIQDKKQYLKDYHAKRKASGWMAKRAEQEDRNFISVGGLISRIDPEWQADVSSVPNVEAIRSSMIRAAEYVTAAQIAYEVEMLGRAAAAPKIVSTEV